MSFLKIPFPFFVLDKKNQIISNGECSAFIFRFNNKSECKKYSIDGLYPAEQEQSGEIDVDDIKLN